MLDAARISLRPEAAPPLPVDRLVLGKSRDEVAELMPRLFNLCRAAQGMAVRLALGIETTDDAQSLRAEILRDHVMRLAMVLPGHFGHAPLSLPRGWQTGEGVAQALFGPTGRLPDTMDEARAFMVAQTGIGALWAQVGGLFRPGEACADALPFVDDATAADPAARVENSCAARVADHPVVAAFGAEGRGPLWRVIARSYDLQAILKGAPLTAATPAPGRAQVPATRGLYTVVAAHDGARVTAFARTTPTDHLRADGGVLDMTLATLPADRGALAPLVLDILDPCSPIRLREVRHA